MPVVITNISSTSLTPNYAGGAPNDPTNFGGSQNCAGVALSGGQSCQFTYTFTPTAPGPWTSSTTIDVDSESFAISLHGTGTDSSTTTTTSSTSTTSSTHLTDDDHDVRVVRIDVEHARADRPGRRRATVVVDRRPAGRSRMGHAEVIAQGVVTFPDGAFVWETEHLSGPGLPFAFSASPPMFLVAGGPDGLLVQGTDGLLAVLGDGEGTYVAPGSTGQRRGVRRSVPRRRL